LTDSEGSIAGCGSARQFPPPARPATGSVGVPKLRNREGAKTRMGRREGEGPVGVRGCAPGPEDRRLPRAESRTTSDGIKILPVADFVATLWAGGLF